MIVTNDKNFPVRSKLHCHQLFLIIYFLSYKTKTANESIEWVYHSCLCSKANSFLPWSSSITRVEDLANEVIYEIFEYLDHFHIYNAFFDLNTRFRQLLTHSNVPIHIDLSTLSKSAWRRYHADLLQCHIDQIRSFRTSNPCMHDLAVSSLNNMLPYDRIENLILENIEYTHLETLLDQLVSFSHLSSLTITTAEKRGSERMIYRQIFRLPALRYCKIALSGGRDSGSLPACEGQFSSLEHLIVTTPISLQELNALLSYVPHLRRLFLNLERRWWIPQQKCQPVCSKLNRLELHVNNIEFNTFEQTFREVFPTSELVHLTLDMRSSTDNSYLDGNKWEQLLASCTPHLQMFDLRCDISAYNNLSTAELDKQFSSPFWIKRQCTFTHHSYYRRFTKHTILHSTQRYRFSSVGDFLGWKFYFFCFRRKQYTLYKRLTDGISVDLGSVVYKSVRQIDIYSEKSITNCTDSFPNAREVHFKDGFSTLCVSIAGLLNRIVPLNQLNKLVIECHHFSLKKMIDLLYYSPNVHTLIFESMPLYKDEHHSIEQNELFRKLSETNTIKHIIFHDRCTIEKVKLLVALCPRVEDLSIHTFARTVEPVVRFLLDRNNPNTRHLSLLRFTRASRIWLARLDHLLKSERLIDDYTLSSTDSHLYLWC